MNKRELENFYNKGFGWICRNCEVKSSKKEKSRLMTEGESENEEPIYSNSAMAKWLDSEQTTLTCQNCDINEEIS